MGGRVCYCTAHYVIVDQWNWSLLNLLKKSSRTEVVRTLSRTLDDIVGRWQLSGSLYVFLIVTSYTLTLIWLTARLRERPTAFRALLAIRSYILYRRDQNYKWRNCHLFHETWPTNSAISVCLQNRNGRCIWLDFSTLVYIINCHFYVYI